MAINKLPADAGGIPSGNTAGRPASPVIGDTYYDGTLGFLLIFDGTSFIPCSAPAAQPTITVADVGTSQPFASPTAIVSFTEGTAGGKAAGFTAIQGSVSGTSTSSPITLTLSAPGTLSFNGTSYNGFGTSPQSLTVNQAITSVPQAPTIGTATASGSVNEVVVTWTLGSNGGKSLSAITITPYLNGTTAGTTRTAATTSSTSYTFTDGQLNPGGAYTFKVSATNANGTGLQSAATNSATMPSFIAGDYLIVAGGGGGGSNWAGGGGAGGFRTSTFSVSGGTNYNITVGAGGAGAPSASVQASDGNTSSAFSSISSSGGGGGGSDTNADFGRNGGSGGGGAIDGSGGNGTGGQGFAGGYGSRAVGLQGGGGGGAGAAGGNGDASPYGFGGPGTASSITGSSVTYAGGGGGGTNAQQNAGGAGGGGAGGTGSEGTVVAGTANLGGGGGASGSGLGAAGGSGVVILRYPDTKTITIGAGLTGSESAASGGYKRATLTAGSGNVSWA